MDTVVDTSVLIDLERCSLLDAFSQLPLQTFVTDILYDNELVPFLGVSRLRHIVKVVELSALEKLGVENLYETLTPLSREDLSSYLLALDKGCLLLTGDRELRKLAENAGVNCHGVLWVFDHLLALGILTPLMLHQSLSMLRDHPRCRLPLYEIAVLLERFEAFFLHNSVRN